MDETVSGRGTEVPEGAGACGEEVGKAEERLFVGRMTARGHSPLSLRHVCFSVSVSVCFYCVFH